MGKWLARFGIASSQFANFVTILGASWGLIVGTILAVCALASDRFTALAHNDNVRAAGAVFLFSLWSYIGVLFLYRHNKPILTKRFENFEYGMTIEGIFPIYDPNSDYVLQFGINVRNYSGQAVRYRLTQFDITIVTRHVFMKEEHKLPQIITFGIARSFYSEPYPKEEMADFSNREVKGTVKIKIEYGPVSGPFLREIYEEMSIHLDFRNPGKLGFNDRILAYKETAFRESAIN